MATAPSSASQEPPEQEAAPVSAPNNAGTPAPAQHTAAAPGSARSDAGTPAPAERTALVQGEAPGEASPHKRRLKCVTNISPRRLMTHLLHQMVHYRTTLRGSEQRSATIARITIHTHATILNTKRTSSESCAMRYLLRVTLIHRQGWVQDGTLLDVVRNKVWIFFCKN